MKNSRKLSVGIMSILLVYFLAALFGPAEISLQQSTTINLPVSQIFREVSDFRNWKHWAPWHFSDPGQLATFSEQMEVPGAWMRWQGKTSGEHQLVAILPDRQVLTNSRLSGNQVFKNQWDLKRGKGNTLLEWEWSLPKIDFWQRPLYLFEEGKMKEQMAAAIEQLTQWCEALPPPPKAQVEKIVLEEPILLLSIRDTANFANVNDKTRECFDDIVTAMQNRVSPATPSRFAIYYQWSKDLIDMEMAIPIKNEIEPEGRTQITSIAKGTYAVAVHNGPHNRLPETYTILQKWLQTNEITPIGPPVEEYVQGPAGTDNESQWITRIYFPLSKTL